MASSAHENFATSLILLCKQFITDAGADLNDPAFVDFDQHSQIDELPKQDLVGSANLHWINDGPFFTVNCSIGVSTFEDVGLFRHRKMIGYIGDQLKPGMSHALYDTNGDKIGFLVVQAGVALLPMAKEGTTTLQFLMVSFQTSQT